jgi:two-component system, NarL family, capsular synthesis sensor histidine kinase RcsC
VVLSRMLARLGQEATLAADGDIVLALCQDRDWDLILMDMQMPHRDGLSATRALRAQGYTGPICGLTANALREDHDRCREAGMDEVLVKPIDLPTLADLLARRSAPAGGAQHSTPIQIAPVG